jgi:hypothetical protein
MSFDADIRDEYSDLDRECLSRVVFENEVKGFQLRLTVSEFRGQYYMGLRKWYVDIDDDWLPTRQGFSWPYDLNTTSDFFCALTEIVSEAQVLHEVAAKLGYLESFELKLPKKLKPTEEQENQ